MTSGSARPFLLVFRQRNETESAMAAPELGRRVGQVALDPELRKDHRSVTPRGLRVDEAIEREVLRVLTPARSRRRRPPRRRRWTRRSGHGRPSNWSAARRATRSSARRQSDAVEPAVNGRPPRGTRDTHAEPAGDAGRVPRNSCVRPGSYLSFRKIQTKQSDESSQHRTSCGQPLRAVLGDVGSNALYRIP